MNEQMIQFQPFQLPKGNLFYPSCGWDTLTAINHFYPFIDTFYFSDIQQIGLPIFQNETDYPSFIHPLSQLAGKVIKQDLIAFDKREIQGGDDRPFSYRLKTMDNWLYRKQILIENHSLTINAYLMDSLHVFETIEQLAIFFYRGDSMLELGSGVMWFDQTLFDQVVDKLVDGGLIITDGLNPNPHALDTPWQNLYAHSHYAFPDLKEGERPDNFIYRNRSFECVGELGPRYGNTYIWKVNNY